MLELLAHGAESTEPPMVMYGTLAGIAVLVLVGLYVAHKCIHSTAIRSLAGLVIVVAGVISGIFCYLAIHGHAEPGSDEFYPTLRHPPPPEVPKEYRTEMKDKEEHEHGQVNTHEHSHD